MDKCNICENVYVEFRFNCRSQKGDTFSIYRCRNCGTGFTYPLPDRHSIMELYGYGYYGEDVRSLPSLKRYAIHILQRGKRRFVERYRPPGRIADIGCGDGSFLEEMLECGWDVYGVDVSERASELVRKKGIRCFRGDLIQCNFPSDYFDVVTLWHVLEHVYDPAEQIREISRILKPDGMVFISVPNFMSIQAVWGRDMWFHLDPPRHIWHFTQDTLTFLLEENGFVPEYSNFSFCEYGLFGWWQTILNRAGLPFNSIYSLLKRRNEYNKEIERMDIQVIICASILFVPLFYILTVLEILLGRSCNITVVGRKKCRE